MPQTLGLAGGVFSLIAAYFLWAAFSIDPVVSVGADAPAGFNGVANLQMMQIQTLDMMVGLAAGLIAAVFWVGAAIGGLVEARTRAAMTGQSPPVPR